MYDFVNAVGIQSENVTIPMCKSGWWTQTKIWTWSSTKYRQVVKEIKMKMFYW